MLRVDRAMRAPEVNGDGRGCILGVVGQCLGYQSRGATCMGETFPNGPPSERSHGGVTRVRLLMRALNACAVPVVSSQRQGWSDTEEGTRACASPKACVEAHTRCDGLCDMGTRSSFSSVVAHKSATLQER
jgi:hypothetical protein